MASARGMIAVDKMGTKVLFLNPETFVTEVVLDGFPKTVHELLVIPEDRKSTRLNSSHIQKSRMPSSA